jgi:hypothetical protein
VLVNSGRLHELRMKRMNSWIVRQIDVVENSSREQLSKPSLYTVNFREMKKR